MKSKTAETTIMRRLSVGTIPRDLMLPKTQRPNFHITKGPRFEDIGCYDVAFPTLQPHGYSSLLPQLSADSGRQENLWASFSTIDIHCKCGGRRSCWFLRVVIRREEQFVHTSNTCIYLMETPRTRRYSSALIVTIPRNFTMIQGS